MHSDQWFYRLIYIFFTWAGVESLNLCCNYTTNKKKICSPRSLGRRNTELPKYFVQQIKSTQASYRNIHFEQAVNECEWTTNYPRKNCDFYFRVNWLYFFSLSLLAVQRLKCVRIACECYVKRLLFHLSIRHSWIRQFLTHFHVDMDQIKLWTFFAYQMWMFWNRIKVTTKRAVRKRKRQKFACQKE